MKRYFILSFLIAVSAIIMYGCGDKMPKEPEMPGGGEIEKPIDPEPPELPDDPFEPSDIFFEDFVDKEIPATFKQYDVDNAIIDGSTIKHAWSAQSGDGIYSYGMLENKARVDDWIVTPAIKISNPNSVLSWLATATNTLVQRQPAATTVEEYEVYISTEGQELSNFQGKTPAYSTKVLKCGTSEKPELNLDIYIGKEIYVAFRHCTQPQNADILRLQNIRVREYPSVDLACSGISFAGEPSHTFKNEQQLRVQAFIYNRSLKEVTTFKARYKYGTQQVEQTFTKTIGRESSTKIEFDTPLVMSKPGESQNICVEVIYDNDQNEPNNADSTQLVCIGAEPHKRVLFEKITSVECVPCGIAHWVVGYTEDKYPDKVVGVSVHANNVTGPDDLGCESFVDAFVAWMGLPNIIHVDGLPAWASCRRFDRKCMDIGGTNLDVERVMNATTAPASIDVEVAYNAADNSFDATVKTIFAADALAEGYYTLGLGVIEDGIKGKQLGLPYDDPNYRHNNIARELIGGYKGVEGSLPKNVVKDAENSYTFHHKIPTTYGIDYRKPIPANMEVVAILYDAITGEALNCIKKPIIKK